MPSDPKADKAKERPTGRKINDWAELYEGIGRATAHTSSSIIATVNLRSQGGDGQDQRKTTGIDTLKAFPESVIPTIFGVVETWERSVSARERVREQIELGWKRIFLDATKPDENRRGGQALNLRGNEWWYKTQMLHGDSILMLRIKRKIDTRNEKGHITGFKYSRKELCILQAYVGTGNHPVKGQEAIQMTKIYEDTIKEAIKNNKDIVVMGDWNNLCKRWRNIGREYGLKMVAQAYPDTIMAKIEGASLEGGYMDKRTEWKTDHMCLWMRIIKQQEDMYTQPVDIRPNSEIIATHPDDYAELLQTELARIKWNKKTADEKKSPSQRYKLETAMRQAGILLTKRMQKERQIDMGHLPNHLQKLWKEIEDAKKQKDRALEKIARKKFFRQFRRWKNERWYERMIEKEEQYETGNKIKWLHRKYIKEAKMADLVTFRDTDGNEAFKPEEVKDKVRSRIGKRYMQAPERSTRESIRQKFEPYTRYKGGLADIGGVPQHSEIEEVIKHFGAKKGMGPDEISKEMVMAAPEEIRKDIYNRVQQLFQEGMAEGDCQTDITLLIKNILKYENDEDNLRPISLIKFISKTAQAVVAWRWKHKELGLTNYGFTKETGCTQAILKIHSILEHALIHNKEIHLMTIDIEKAYDTVRFDILEEAMTRYGIPEDIKRMLMDAHTKRDIQIKTGWGKTEKLRAQCGLAQGSPVSCLLFIMVMQPLLDRLRAETKGIWSTTDDVAYADDVTLLAPDAAEMAKKWKIVKEFSKYTGLKISLKKTEYMTNVADPVKRMQFKEKEKEIKQVTEDEAIRILGYWNNIALKKDFQHQKMMDGVKLIQRAMYRHQLPPKMVIGVINMIINAKVRFIGAFLKALLMSQPRWRTPPRGGRPRFRMIVIRSSHCIPLKAQLFVLNAPSCRKTQISPTKHSQFIRRPRFA